MTCGSERRTAPRARQQRTQAASRRRADDHHAAARPQNTQQLADRGDAVFGAHRADEAVRVVDHCEIERGIVCRQTHRRSDFDLHEDAGLRRALAHARGGRLVGHDGHGAPR